METREQNMARQQAAKDRASEAMERMCRAASAEEWDAARAEMERACADEVQAVNDWHAASAAA